MIIRNQRFPVDMASNAKSRSLRKNSQELRKTTTRKSYKKTAATQNVFKEGVALLKVFFLRVVVLRVDNCQEFS